MASMIDRKRASPELLKRMSETKIGLSFLQLQ